MEKVKIEIWGIERLADVFKNNEDYELLNRLNKLKSEYELESLSDYVRLLEFIAEISDGDFSIYNCGTTIDLLS